MTENIDSFDISLYHSELHALNFGVVYPNEKTDDKYLKNRIKNFIDFNIAIKPNVAVILFNISKYAETGSPVFNIDNNGMKLHHIPKQIYHRIDEIIIESPFVVSDVFLTHIINQKKSHKSVFTSLLKYHQEHGLIVLGVFDEIEETQI